MYLALLCQRISLKNMLIIKKPSNRVFFKQGASDNHSIGYRLSILLTAKSGGWGLFEMHLVTVH